MASKPWNCASSLPFMGVKPFFQKRQSRVNIGDNIGSWIHSGLERRLCCSFTCHAKAQEQQQDQDYGRDRNHSHSHRHHGLLAQL